MNGKKAKALRREAERLTINYPDVAYRKHGMQTFKKAEYLDEDLIKHKFVRTGDWDPIVMLHACTRNIYKLLKTA